MSTGVWDAEVAPQVAAVHRPRDDVLVARPAHLVQKLSDRPGDRRPGRDRAAIRAQPGQTVRRQLPGREALGESALRLAHIGMGPFIPELWPTWKPCSRKK